jgi:RNA polymerase sigma factor (TIGR02999 family)
MSHDDGMEPAKSLDELLPQVYPELRSLAARYFRSERRAHTLQPTALVHEVYLRLAESNSGLRGGRAQLLALAAKAMRSILIDHARRRNAEKREGAHRRVTLELIDRQGTPYQVDLLALHEALERLDRDEPVKSQVVELRFFGGLSIEETAEALGISTGTVKRQWTTARAWLFRELHGTV